MVFAAAPAGADRRIRKPSHENLQRFQRETVLRCTGTLACALCHAANAYHHSWDEGVAIVDPLLLHALYFIRARRALLR